MSVHKSMWHPSGERQSSLTLWALFLLSLSPQFFSIWLRLPPLEPKMAPLYLWHEDQVAYPWILSHPQSGPMLLFILSCHDPHFSPPYYFFAEVVCLPESCLSPLLWLVSFYPFFFCYFSQHNASFPLLPVWTSCSLRLAALDSALIISHILVISHCLRSEIMS